MVYIDFLSFLKHKKDDAVLKKRNLNNQDISNTNQIESEEELRMKQMSINELVKNAQSTDVNIQLNAIQAIRKLLSSDKNPPIDQIIQAKMLPLLVECLTKDDFPNIQFEAAWALTNIASGVHHIGFVSRRAERGGSDY